MYLRLDADYFQTIIVHEPLSMLRLSNMTITLYYSFYTTKEKTAIVCDNDSIMLDRSSA